MISNEPAQVPPHNANPNGESASRMVGEGEMADLLAIVLDATTDGVLSVDRNWSMVYRNRRAQEVLEAAGELTGRQIWDVFPEAAFEGSPFYEHYHRAMEQRIPGKFEGYYPAPLNAWYAVHVQPAENGIVIFFRDITEAKRAESALLKSEKLAAVGRLASSIAHEINNPLESVINLIYLARHSDVADSKKYLDMADEEIRRVSIIANQTLRFHKQASNPQATTAADLFSTVMSIYEGRLRTARVAVEKKFRSGDPVVCFQGDVRQVLNNLVSNALEAMPLGGRLLIRSRTGHHWQTGQRGLILTIADNGGGIPQAVQKHIFDAFFTTKGTAGNGLGLWVCQEIVERHHGTLRVRSCQRAGRNGTTFTLFLPFDSPREVHAADEDEAGR